MSDPDSKLKALRSDKIDSGYARAKTMEAMSSMESALIVGLDKDGLPSIFAWNLPLERRAYLMAILQEEMAEDLRQAFPKRRELMT